MNRVTPDDPMHGQIEQAYRELWRWLGSPAPDSSALLSTLEGVLLQICCPEPGKAPHLQLACITGWLSLIDPTAGPLLDRLIAAPVPSSDPELGAISLARSGQIKEALALIETLAVRGSSTDVPLDGLILELKNLGQRQARGEFSRLWIDTTSFQLWRQGRVWISEPLTCAFELLSRSPVVLATELAANCWGIKRFEPEVHNPRVFNLLFRMRELCPKGVGVTYRAGKIHALGDWATIELWSEGRLVRSLKQNPRWPALLGQLSRPNRSPALRAAGPKRWPERELQAHFAKLASWTRQELEIFLGVSKSTATRVLTQWNRNGRLEATGKGKRRKYRLLSPQGESKSMSER